MTANRDTIIVVANEDNSIPFFAMKHHLISDV
jgi:replication factor A1